MNPALPTGKGNAALDALSHSLPQLVAASLREQVLRIKALSTDKVAIEKSLGLHLQAGAAIQRIAQIPGLGLLTSISAIATMGQASAFKSGREFCAWLGLVPKQTGSGGKVRLGGISKRGDTYLRTLLIHGARSVLSHAKEPGLWLEGLKARRPANVVIVAQEAKMARPIWAVTAKEQAYQQGFKRVRLQAA
jgi:transposase